MAFAHDHHHHHHHHHGHHHDHDDAHDAPFDAANESIANALRSSFRVLKFIMFVLVIMYCFSGVECIDENEEAVVLRFGKLLPGVRPSGLSRAFPYPIDETIVVTTKRDNKLDVRHWPQVRPEQEGQPLNKVRPAGGLNPAIDGALLTADKGMVHMHWSVTYRITDLRNFVLFVADRQAEKLDDLIAGVLDNAAIRVVSQYTAEEATRGKTTEIAERVKAAVNTELEALQSGVTVVAIDVPKSSVPGQTIDAFDMVTRAENEKNKLIRESDQRARDILNRVAGAEHEELIAKLNAYDLAVAEERAADADALRAEIDAMIETRVGGDAGRAIREARSFYTRAVQQIRGEVTEYQAALAEYLATPELFINRMWEDTRARLMQQEGVTKHFIAKQADEVRIKIGKDPEQRKLDEQRKLQQEAEQRDFSTPQQLHTVIPEE